jgi:hypothetical protein
MLWYLCSGLIEKNVSLVIDSHQPTIEHSLVSSCDSHDFINEALLEILDDHMVKTNDIIGLIIAAV